MSFRMVVRGCHQRFAVTAYFPTSALRSAKPLSNSLSIVLSMLKIVPKTRLRLGYGPALVQFTPVEYLRRKYAETELDAALGRDRYERPRLAETCGGGRAVKRAGYRHGHRERQLMGTFGPATVRVPRARLETSEGKTVERKNATIPAYQRRTKLADALIAGAYLAGTNTRRVRRALAALLAAPWGRTRSAEFGAR
jgi:hypothetical protein